MVKHLHLVKKVENGDLYGSIKPKEITSAIKENVNAEISPSQVILKKS